MQPEDATNGSDVSAGIPYPKCAVIFLLVGLFVALGVTCLMNAPGWGVPGDGAGQYEDEPVGLVWLYSSYFFCGAIAACLANRKARIGAAVVAHSLPFAGLLFANSDQARVLCGIALGTFAVFGVAWLHMLVKTDLLAL